MTTEFRSSTDSSTHEFEFSGGALCLDFVNTVADRPRNRQEHLSSYDDLLDWALQAEVIDSNQRNLRRQLADQERSDASEIFSGAIELRECLYRIFSRVANEDPPAGSDLDVLNGWIRSAMARLRLTDRNGGLAWTWSDSDNELESVLWPVVRSAADLLTSDEVSRVGECDGDPCSWLFIDRSRTGRRRWCDMKTCGNRDKARRYYRRHKAKQ